MKRPLACLCIACVIFLAAVHRFGEAKEASPPCLAVEYLQESVDSRGRVTLWGTVSECNAVSEGIRLSIDHISIQKSNDSRKSLLSDLKITFTTKAELAPGDVLRVRGEIKEFEPATNPGQFDARKWYFAQGIACTLRQAEILKILPGEMSMGRALYLLRSRLRESYTRILGEKAARTISAITLGEKRYLEQEWKEVYQEGGIAHILAISGLHITLLCMGLYRFLRRMGAGFWPASLLGGTAAVLYTVMTGAGISAVRAAVMFVMWLGSQICGRKQDTLTAAAVAALALTLAEGGNPFQASFLLSFGAVASLGILLPRLQADFNTEKGLPGGILAGIAIWLGTLPCTLYFYYQASPWSLIVNLAVIPLMSVLMTVGLVSAAAGIVWIPLGMFLGAPVSYILEFFEWLCTLEGRLPGAVWVLGRPDTWRIVLYYGILGAMALFRGDTVEKRKNCRKRLRNGAVWMLCGAVCMLLMVCRDSKEMTVICMDVGQGDGCLIQFPTGENCLIDGGSSSKSGVWDNILSQTVKYYGVRRLDYIFLSHADLDHISGVQEFLEAYEPGFAQGNVHGVSVNCLVLPPTADPADFEELISLAKEKGITVLRMEAGDCISRENCWSISCLAPEEEELSGDRNQDSMVLRLQYGDFSMLFTGDLEEAAETRLAASGEELRADVLKVGHHGSGKASSAEFLSQVGAEFAVISCGRNNIYGHPAPDAVERLKAAGCHILQTDKSGAVILQTDGRKYGIGVYGGAESDGKD